MTRQHDDCEKMRELGVCLLKPPHPALSRKGRGRNLLSEV